MRQRYPMVISLGMLLVAGFSASCQKPFHQETERYILVAANINLEYWQEAGAGFNDAARGLGVKADFQGPTSRSPEEELKVFKEAVAQHPTGILVSPARPELFNDAINEAIAAGIPVITMDTDAPDSKRVLYIGTDNRQAGMESGRQIAKLMNGQGQLVVVTVPLLLVALLPLPAPVTSTGLLGSAPLYSRIRMSGAAAAAEKVTVTLLAPAPAAWMLLA